MDVPSLVVQSSLVMCDEALRICAPVWRGALPWPWIRAAVIAHCLASGNLPQQFDGGLETLFEARQGDFMFADHSGDPLRVKYRSSDLTHGGKSP